MSKFTKAFKESEDYQFLQSLIKTPDENLVDFLEENKEKLGYKPGQKLPKEQTLKKAKSHARARVCKKLDELVEKQTTALDNLTQREDTQLNEKTTNSQLKQRQEQLAKHNKEIQRLLKIYEALEIERSEEINQLVEEANKQVESYGKQADELDEKFKTQHSRIDDLNFIAVHTNNPFGFGYKKMNAGENIFAHAGQQEKNPEAASELAQEKADEVENAPVYKGHQIKKDEAIVATKVYDNKAKGILKQFPNGKVSNFSEGPLTNENKNEIAMQQVAMLVANYNPDKGKIILRGHDKEMVKKVYAGLLLASKELGVDRKDIDKLVDVRVPNIKPGWTTSYDSFIKSNLGDGGFLGFNKKIKNEEKKGRTIEEAVKVGTDFRERLNHMKSEAKKTINEDVEETIQKEAGKEIKLGPK